MSIHANAVRKVGSIRASRHDRGSVRQSSKEWADAKQAAANAVLVDYSYFTPTLFVVAFESSGSMPIFLGRGGRLVKVYTFADHFVAGPTMVNQVWCLEQSIAVQLSNGDVRHFEFLLDGAMINIKELPLDTVVST